MYQYCYSWVSLSILLEWGKSINTAGIGEAYQNCLNGVNLLILLEWGKFINTAGMG